MEIPIRAILVLTFALATSGCNDTTLQGNVHVTPERKPQQLTRVRLLINDNANHPYGQDLPEAWRRGPIKPDVASTTSPVMLGGYVSDAPYQHFEPEYTTRDIWLGAFLDVNDNGALDDGEAYGLVPDAVKRPTGGDDVTLTVDLVIDSVWPPPPR